MSNIKVKFRKGAGTPTTFNNGDIIFDKENKKLSMKVDDTVITAGNVTYDVVSNKYQFNETVNPPAEAVEGDIEFTILNGEFPNTEVTHIALGTEEGFTITVREQHDPVPLKYNGMSNMLIQMTTASSVEGVMNWIDDNAVNSIKGQLKDVNTGANIIPEIESSGATWGSITGNIQDQGDLSSRLVLLEEGKQATLVSSGEGQNIKTINGEDILGSGDIEIEAAPKWIEKEAEMPVKGDLITINDAPDGAKNYRVLQINGGVAEVLGMDNIIDELAFDSSGGKIYAGSTLDTYLNETWYNDLSDTMKNAIVAKSFSQDSWYSDDSGDPKYYGRYGESVPGGNEYSISFDNASYQEEITRNIYALSVQDVIDYLGVEPEASYDESSLQNNNIWQMYYNAESYEESYDHCWLRSASHEYSSSAVIIKDNGQIRNYSSTSTRAVRASFQINLSQVSWEKQSSNVNGTDIDVKFQYGPEASLDQENGTISVATDTNKVSVDMNGVRINLQNAEEGKVLSSNDFTDEYKTKLEGIAANATQVEVSDTGTAEEEVNYITVTTANGHGTQKKIGGGANFTIGAGPLVIPQETTVNSASQQDWDPNYEYKYKFDIAVSGITATTRLTNMVAVLNTAYDNLAPNFDTVSGGLTFYTKEETLSEDITFSSYDIFTKNIKHDIDVNVTGNGSINAIPNKQVAGKQIALDINPDEGYALGAMAVKDAQDNDIAVGENNKFTMPDSNVTVTANFGDARTITLGDVEHGFIFASKDQAAQGAIIKLESSAEEGYVFEAWDVKTSHAVSITVTDDKFEMPDEDVTVNATFKTE